MNADLLWDVSVWVIPVVLAITLHEASHGFVAHLFGDDTAWNAGRVSANPFRHIDPFGTILLPAMLRLAGSPFVFGYAKPVPVNFWGLRNPKRDMIWVAGAGPVTNILMATTAGILTHVLPPAIQTAVMAGLVTQEHFPTTAAGWLGANLLHALEINVVLAVFNMIPMPPLDGGRVAVGLLPRVLAAPLARLERYGMLILIGLLIVVPAIAQWSGYDFDPVAIILEWPVSLVLYAIVLITGIHG